MGSALSTFNDFVNSTGPSFLTSAEDVVNEAVKKNYLLRRFLKGQDTARIIQGGSTIKDEILFDEQSTFQFYQPNETFTWQNPQVLTEWEINWRFAVDHMAWTDQEIELNVNSGFSQTARHQMYKRLKRVKEQRLWTSILNGMEEQLFAVPKVANQETNTGTEPYSIPAFVNEEANGLFHSTATVTGETAWTTVQGINAANESRWRPARVTYTSARAVGNPTTDGIEVVNADNILAAFDDMYLTIRFDTPPTREEYFENMSLYRQFIACSRNGINIYKRLMRGAQDAYVTQSRQDPAYNKPQYSGIDLEYVAELDTAALYEAETATNALVTEMAGAGTGESNGPRYYWLNANYMNVVFHTSRYMYKHPVMTHPNQPFTHIAPCDSWYNLVCRSRQRQGIVVPNRGADLYT
jgi:hypothetical protein